MSKAKGNSNWFYFWYRATPDKVLDCLAEYGHLDKNEILQKHNNADSLCDYAEEVGLIKEDRQ